jgi:hypothetical protein
VCIARATQVALTPAAGHRGGGGGGDRVGSRTAGAFCMFLALHCPPSPFPRMSLIVFWILNHVPLSLGPGQGSTWCTCSPPRPPKPVTCRAVSVIHLAVEALQRLDWVVPYTIIWRAKLQIELFTRPIFCRNACRELYIIMDKNGDTNVCKTTLSKFNRWKPACRQHLEKGAGRWALQQGR